MENHVRILDCTLRDGGYYTNWDFDSDLVTEYYQAIEKLPIEYVEIGYRSVPQKEYFGEYFYCPKYVLNKAKTLMPNKKLAIMLNEKDTRIEDLDYLLNDCEGIVSLVRMAVSPQKIEDAILIAKEIKLKGFEVAFNVMYMSQWANDTEIIERFKKCNGLVDFFYMVDSFGGVLPKEVEKLTKELKSKLDVEVGFHGHNNIELALANVISSIEGGIDIIDSTITGIGRGAGNLKTELLLTFLSNKYGVDVDFNALTNTVVEFELLQKKYMWGTNLPYMVSGINSLPQKDVMEWITRRFYSINSIIIALQNMKDRMADNLKLPMFNSDNALHYKTVLIIGGGPSAVLHFEAIRLFIEKNKHDICLIHASTKNAWKYKDIDVAQFFCLVGNEGYRMEKVFDNFKVKYSKCILPSYPRKMGTYIPNEMKSKAFELNAVNFVDCFTDSHTALALQTAIDVKCESTYLVGYDGYSSEIQEKEKGLIQENEYLFDVYNRTVVPLISLTSTHYNGIAVQSIFSLI